ncbi:MAG: hypothetical protein HXX14_13915 [Bacteroidetes bacterium]|nr:hypothetical protein [Bacteroidota bacterium]
MKKSFLLALLALFIGLATFAQDKGQSSNTNKGFDPYWYLNLNVGRSLVKGDLSSFPLDLGKLGTQTGFWTGFMAGHQFSPLFGLRGVITGGTANSRIDEPTYKFQTKTHYFGYFIEPTLDITNLIHYNADRKFFVYAFTGLGVGNFYDDVTNNITGVETTLYKDGGRATATTLPYGIGAKYKFDENWGVTLENASYYAFNKTAGDKIDGKVIGTDRDWLNNTSIGINYDITDVTNLKKMAANYGQIKYEVTPNPLEMHGDSVVVTIKGTVPEKYMAKKAAIQIAPELKYNGGTYPLNPITLKGEDVAGDGIAIPYKTGGTFTVKQTIPYMPGMSASDLVANPIIYKPATGAVDSKATAQQIHANNKFIDVPSHKIADGVIATPLLIKHDEDLLTAADKLVKEKFASKDATIYFLVNKDKLDWKLPLNKNKQNQAVLADLNTFINQGWQIKNIEVDGYASPEGEESFNQGLSAKRAVTGKDYVVNLFKKWAADKNATEFQKNLGGVMINTASKGEDWDGFMQSVQASNLKDKNAIVNIVNSQSDVNKREQEIRNMTRVFKTLKADILPALRRVNITVNSYQPVKTDEQFLSAATNNPETLNLEELLYSATLTKDANTQLAIYKATLKQNEGDWRAFNNAGEIELKNGNISQAASYLNTANSLSPNNVIVLNNLGAVEAKKGNVKAAIDLFKKAQGLGANEGYNAGIPQITKAKYNDAVTALNVKKCNHNLGLAQLLAGNSAAAIATLKCAPAAADTYYVLAIAGARTNDTALLYESLMKSIKMDSSYKAKAGIS